MITLYPHQKKVIDEARQALRTYQSVLIQAPTGFGKTVVAAYMIKRAIDKGLSVWFVCHRSELLHQTSKTLSKFSIDHSFVANGFSHETSSVHLCSIGTLKSRVHKLKQPELVIWDEAHHIAARGWASVKDVLSYSKHVGLSATPQRLDGSGLDAYFDHMVLGPSVEWLIENKYLSQYIAYSSPQADLSSVKNQAGDFNKRQLAEAMDKPSITGDIVKHWIKYARDKKTIIFAASVAHSESIATSFRDKGVVAFALDGNTPRDERANTCKAFANGDIDVLCNVDLFGEGFDIASQADKDVTIECVVMARPTQSLSLYLQQVGRALRPKKNPAIILDHAGNCLRHGLPDEDRVWSLGSSKRASNDEGAIPIKQCDKCFHVHRPAKQCPRCGNVYEVKEREIEFVDGELEEMSKDELKRKQRDEQSRALTLDSLIQLGIKRGYKHPEKWASYIYTARMQRRRA